MPVDGAMTKGSRAASKWFDLHPFLWAVQPILFLYARAYEEVSAVKILAPLGVALAGAGLIWALAFLILRRDFRKSACLTSVLLFLFFSFGRIVDLAGAFLESTGLWPNLGRMQLPTRTVSLQAVILAVYAVVVCALLVRLATRKPLSERIPPLLAVTALVLLLISTGQIAVGLLSARPDGSPPDPAPAAARVPTDLSPDVYIIVVDGYARGDVLREFYGFDNTPFLCALEELGFGTLPKSSANYAWTFLSLASALNMTPLDELAGMTRPGSRDQRRAQDMIRNNAVMAFLKGRGYRTIQLASAWAGTRVNPYADEVRADRNHIMDDDFTRALVDSSLLVLNNARLLRDMALFYLDQFDGLEAVAAEPSPKMVFSHFLLPHHPYIFDRDGAVVRNGSFVDILLYRKAQWYRTDAYIEQLRFLNTRLLTALRAILRTSPVPPIIVLISDHGPLIVSADAEAAKRARLDNLTAALLPGAPAGFLPEDVQLINVFPLVLNHYFDAGLALRPPERYYSLYARPYEFELIEPEPSSQKETKIHE
jgi:hypothetical protein